MCHLSGLNEYIFRSRVIRIHRMYMCPQWSNLWADINYLYLACLLGQSCASQNTQSFKLNAIGCCMCVFVYTAVWIFFISPFVVFHIFFSFYLVPFQLYSIASIFMMMTVWYWSSFDTKNVSVTLTKLFMKLIIENNIAVWMLMHPPYHYQHYHYSVDVKWVSEWTHSHITLCWPIVWLQFEHISGYLTLSKMYK